MKPITMTDNVYLAAVALLLASAVGSVDAAKSADNDAHAMADAKISLTPAVSAAEQHVGGQASRAEYAQHQGQGVFDVEVLKGKPVMAVTANSRTGTLIAVVEDQAKRKEGRNHDHERDHEGDD